MKVTTKIVLTCLAAALAIFLIGSITPKSSKWYTKQRFYLIKAISKKKHNVIIMGDSRATVGVSPFEIENQSPNLSAFNMGFSNGGLNPTMFDLAESKLDTTKEQKTIVLSLTALTVHPLSLTNEQYLGEINRSREDKLSILYFSDALSYFSPVTPKKLINHLKKVKPWREHIQTFYDNGWAKSYLVPYDTSQAIPSYIKDYKQGKLSNDQLEMVYKQVSDWTNKGIDVVCFRPPTTIQMKSLEDSAGGYDEVKISAAITKAGGHWINFDFTEYFSYDGSHLDDTSAVKLSKKLALKIAELQNN